MWNHNILAASLNIPLSGSHCGIEYALAFLRQTINQASNTA